MVDVSAPLSFIADQAVPIVLIGGAVLLLTVVIHAAKWVRRLISIGPGPATPKFSAQDDYQVELDRLRSVRDQWASSGPGYHRQSYNLYKALVAGGAHSIDAIEKVEARNAAVERSEQRAIDKMQAEHDSAIAAASTSDLDVTVKLGGGWK